LPRAIADIGKNVVPIAMNIATRNVVETAFLLPVLIAIFLRGDHVTPCYLPESSERLPSNALPIAPKDWRR
jgi:hypothetical protein